MTLDSSALSEWEVLWRLLRYINLLTYLLTSGGLLPLLGAPLPDGWVTVQRFVQQRLTNRRRRLVVIVVCTSVDNRTRLRSNRCPFLAPRGGGGGVVSAIRRNWNRVSLDWQIAVDYRVRASLITGDPVVLSAGSSRQSALVKPRRETNWFHYAPLSTTSFVLDDDSTYEYSWRHNYRRRTCSVFIAVLDKMHY